MNLSITLDAREVLGFFNSLSRQVPFATSKAINALAVHGQRQVQSHLAESFTLRRPEWVTRTIKMWQWATKANLAAVVEVDPTRNVLAKFEAGGLKRPRGNSLAVPINVRRTKADIVAKSMRIRELQLRAHRTSKGRVQLRGLRKTFGIKGPSGGAILQRVRKGHGRPLAEEIAAGSVRVVYAFKKSVPIPANLRFTATFRDAAKAWPRFMMEAFNEALRTAR